MGKIVKVVIGNKVWEMTRKMAIATLSVAESKYNQDNANAIYAVEKDGIISLQKDVFDNTESLEREVTNWQKGGYKCYYTTKKDDEVK